MMDEQSDESFVINRISVPQKEIAPKRSPLLCEKKTKLIEGLQKVIDQNKIVFNSIQIEEFAESLLLNSFKPNKLCVNQGSQTDECQKTQSLLRLMESMKVQIEQIKKIIENQNLTVEKTH
jgi:hypothetical protein